MDFIEIDPDDLVEKKICDECFTQYISTSHVNQRFCSESCRIKNRAKRDYGAQSYAAQQARGIKRKDSLVEVFGGKCQICGYDKNYAALAFHHIDPANKSFSLDQRSLSCRAPKKLIEEAKKCRLLCQNCHVDLHYPHRRREGNDSRTART